MDQIHRLKTEPITDAALSDAKEFTKGNILLSSESTDNQMVRLAQNEIHFGRYVPVQDTIKKISAVTIEEIKSLCEEMFTNVKPAAVFLGPITDTTPYAADRIHFE